MKRFIMIMIFTSMLLSLTACTNNNIENATTSETSYIKETADVTNQDVIMAEATTTEKETTTNTTTTTKKETKPEIEITTSEFIELNTEEYFTEHGYIFEEYNKIYIDMNDYDDNEQPFAGLDKEYLNDICTLVVKNAGNTDINFISKCTYISSVIFEDINGSIDMSFISQCQSIQTIIFKNICGNVNFNASNKVDIGNIEFIEYDSTDLSSLAECANIGCVTFNNYDGKTNLGFISKFDSPVDLKFNKPKISIKELSELLKPITFASLSVVTENYYQADGEFLIKSFPNSSVWYGQYMFSQDGYFLWEQSNEDYKPTKDIVFYTQPIISPGTDDTKWKCRTSGLEYNNDNPEWNYLNSLICVFSNYSNTAKIIDTAKLYKLDNGEEPVVFKNGKDTLEVNLDLPAEQKVDFELSENMIDYDTLEPGIYEIAFICGDERYEQFFAVKKNSTPEFLTEEQQVAYYKAYEITKKYFGCSYHLSKDKIEQTTTDEFLAEICEGYTYDYAVKKASEIYIDENGNLKEICADRGGNVLMYDHFFLPIYSDTNEVIFQNIVINAHKDYLYDKCFETFSYRMVKTDDGWKFSDFSLWY